LTDLSGVADWIPSLKVGSREPRGGPPVRKEGHILGKRPWSTRRGAPYSARTARWPEGDTGAEGKPPHEIQRHPVGIFADFKLDELPEQLRFLGWATYRETKTAIVVTAERPGADPLLLGSWPRSVWLEYVRRFYEAEGE
jgi:hypothetical protein